MSDHWNLYPQLVEADKLIQSKAETYTVEGYNTRLRHYLARLKRKTLCYSCILVNVILLYFTADAPA
jgi:insertion element IS1 protein InsB